MSLVASREFISSALDGSRRQLMFQPDDVFKQPPRGELQEIKAELPVLEIELLQLVVADLQKLSCRLAFQCRHALVIE